MNKGLMRPMAALFPMALLLAALFGNGLMVKNLVFYYFAIQLFSLCSIDSFRNAAAREPGVNRVDRRFSGTWLVIAFGIAACVAVECFSEWGQNQMILIAAAGFTIIEQLFEERMYALSHPSDGIILSLISNILLFGGLMIDSVSGMAAPMNLSGFYTTCCAALSMVLAVVISYTIEPMHAFSLIPSSIGFFPKACMQTLFYPAVLLLLPLLKINFVTGMVTNVAANMAGLILWRLSRTVCRRAQDESRILNLILVTITGASVIAAMYGVGFAYPVVMIIAMICAAIVFCAPSWRLYAGIVFVSFALTALNMGIKTEQMQEVEIIVFACFAVAVILNLYQAFLRKV